MSKIDNIDYGKYKRFFSFGCSFTDYQWPTWADIIGKHIPEYYNCGQSGAGNIFISNQISEMHQRYNFQKDDLIIVMWSSINREDKYIKNHWVTYGNIYNNDFYDKSYIKKYVDYRGFLIRDLALISMTYYFLNSLECDFCMLSMSNLVKLTYNCGEHANFDKFSDQLSDVLKLYHTVISNIKPSFYDSLYDGNPPKPLKLKKRTGNNKFEYFFDGHAGPLDHLKYLAKVFENLKISKKVYEFIFDETKKMNSYTRTNYEYDLNSVDMLWKKRSKLYDKL
jgi:hypothetical protein